MSWTYEAVCVDVITELVDLLQVETSEVVPTARVIKDLGAESIDFVDLSLRLKRRFNLVFLNYDLFPITSLDIGDKYLGDILDDRETFNRQHPHLLLGNAPLSAETIRDLYTVAAICRFVALKLNVPIPT